MNKSNEQDKSAPAKPQQPGHALPGKPNEAAKPQEAAKAEPAQPAGHESPRQEPTVPPVAKEGVQPHAPAAKTEDREHKPS